MFKKIEALAAKCSGTASTSVVQLTQACPVVYSQLMAEYTKLSSVNAPYADIKKIKDQIAQVEAGTNCTIEAKKEQTVEEHKSLVAEVKKALNFGSKTESIIPANVTPNFCTDSVVNGLQEQLAANDTSKLNEIKEKIETILEDDGVRANTTKKSVLQFALNTATTVETERILAENADNKEQLATDNFARNLATLADSMLNSKGARTILAFFENNMDNVKSMADSLDKIPGFDSFKAVLEHGGSAFHWDGKTFVQDTATPNQDDITFAFPSNAKADTNDAVVTLRSVQTLTYEKTAQYGPYEDKNGTVKKYDLKTAVGFGKAARESGAGGFWSTGIPVNILDKDLYNTLKANGTWVNDNNGKKSDYVNFQIVQVLNERRAYVDYNLTTYMPDGAYTTDWGTTYTVAK